MKRKIVESILEGLRGFTKPSVVLEQYPTPAHLAADVMHFADEGFDDVQDKVVLDLGCGCGMLSIAAAVKGAEIVIGVDVDQEALQVFEDNRENVQDMCDIDLEIECILADVKTLTSVFRSGHFFDTILMNPPFGTKVKGADVDFLRTAFAIASGGGGNGDDGQRTGKDNDNISTASTSTTPQKTDDQGETQQRNKTVIYSLHKTSTRKFIDKFCTNWDKESPSSSSSTGTVVAEMRFNLPKTLRFHKKDSVDVLVDLWRFEIHTRRRGKDVNADEA